MINKPEKRIKGWAITVENNRIAFVGDDDSEMLIYKRKKNAELSKEHYWEEVIPVEIHLLQKKPKP